jgi:tetratricopeptide (TPR) repeat protein
VRWLQNDHAGLTRQATEFDDASAAEPRYHWFAALTRLTAGDHAGTLQSCARLAERADRRQPSTEHPNGAAGATLVLATEACYLAGLAQLELHDYAGAARSLAVAGQTPASPSHAQSMALWGLACFQQHRHQEAVERWQAVDAGRRAAWKLNETLAHTVFLTAVEAFHDGRFEQAAEKLRQAGKLGCRDRRLGPLLVLSLFKAGQQVVYGYKMS